MSYQTIFRATQKRHDEWHEKSLVRTCDPLRFSSQTKTEGYLFSPDLIPAADHPLALSLGTQACNQLRAWRLVDYLSKTVRVEFDLVNKAINQILTLLNLPDIMRIDASKVYTDEGYHVVMMLELQKQLSEKFNLDFQFRHSNVVDKIEALIAILPKEYYWIGIITSTIITETLITSSLKQVNDSRLIPEIATLFYDHGRDEAKHHAFFTLFARYYFPTLNVQERGVVEELAPRIIAYFLDPDLSLVVSDLINLGLNVETANQVVSESYDVTAIKNGMLASSYASRRLFTLCGFSVDNNFQNLLNNYNFLNN